MFSPLEGFGPEAHDGNEHREATKDHCGNGGGNSVASTQVDNSCTGHSESQPDGRQRRKHWCDVDQGWKDQTNCPQKFKTLRINQ